MNTPATTTALTDAAAAVVDLPAAMKRCGACKQVLPVENFAYKVKPRGLLSSKCRTCTSDYFGGYYRKNRDEVIARVKPAVTAQRKRLNELVAARLATSACGCGASTDLVLRPDPDLTNGLRMSQVIRNGWATEKVMRIVDEALARPGGILCRACLGQESGPKRAGR